MDQARVATVNEPYATLHGYIGELANAKPGDEFWMHDLVGMKSGRKNVRLKVRKVERTKVEFDLA